ncbi:hypothetical protein QBC47DRAFT_429981 [Echria macrotheca]|uniref:Beta-mannosidase B n=1 Tax=Echria macrotheca TaxID=438768 RepID=A0AAJ0F467_9PEZI|nr:hypothetical protein QBC47DRAFT_429981 [Echria macrotheca]
MTHRSQLLSEWQFKSTSRPESTWHPARVPSTVHTELLATGQITDPFIDLNELDARWVADESWTYRTFFPTPSSASSSSFSSSHRPDTHKNSDKEEEEEGEIDLIFEGLDTFATVRLNGKTILTSENMFLSHRVSVKHLLKRDDSNKGENELEIIFEPAAQKGLELVKSHPEHLFIVHQTDVSRATVRKAQYHWGWDWGPILVTCGPWRPVRLEVYTVRVEYVRVEYDVSLSKREPAMVTGRVVAEVVGWERCRVGAEVVFDGVVVGAWDMGVYHDGGGEKRGELVTEGFSLRDVKLWWPRGYGPQNLYQVRVRCFAPAEKDDRLLAEQVQTIGFRKAELVQDGDVHGKSFFFRINGVDIFCGGSCWVPADSFLSRISPAQYRSWVDLVASGNQTMLRIWGGGIYEDDALYTACDERGILVWQDFMFACASYPTYLSFLSSVTTEARQNLRRLGSHPSVVLWCGNNEDYQLVERYNLHYDFADKDPASWLKSDFPARYIYEHLLPSLVTEELGPSATYHPSSPWGTGTSTTLKVDPTVGDIHQWNTWHGSLERYQSLPQLGGRFVSEFGMQSLPHLQTLHRFVTDPSELVPGSATIDFHNKAVTHQRRLATYMAENFRIPASLEGYVHVSQVMQADALAWAYKSWRREWRDGDRKCGGVLVWQLNDCWPTVSWSVVDYFRLKKPAWYAMRRALGAVAVAVTRDVWDWTSRPADELWKRDTGHVDLRQIVERVKFDVWVASSGLCATKGRVVVRVVSVRTGEDVVDRMEREVEIAPNGTTDVLVEYELEDKELLRKTGYVVVYAALWVDGEKVSSDVSWPDPIKYLDFLDRGVRVEPVGDMVLKIACDKPVKGFVFAEREGVEVSDNGFDVIPGEDVHVKITGAKPEELDWTFIGS